MSLDREKSSKLLLEMRLFGLEVNSQMNRVIGKNHKQFLIASAISRREIETGTFQILIQDTRSHFLRLLSGANGIYGRSRYLQFRRVVFLMNWKTFTGRDSHTEARLLDPTGKILENIKNRKGIELCEADLVHNQGFLARLRNDFRKEFGNSEDCIIAIFSFFLPCTQDDHMCSMLVGKYAEISKTSLIVSYEMPFRTTDKELSLCLMNNDKILIIHPEYYTFLMNVYFLTKILLQAYVERLFQTSLRTRYTNNQGVPLPAEQYLSPTIGYGPAAERFLGRNAFIPVGNQCLHRYSCRSLQTLNQGTQLRNPCTPVGNECFQRYSCPNKGTQICNPFGYQCFQNYLHMLSVNQGTQLHSAHTYQQRSVFSRKKYVCCTITDGFHETYSQGQYQVRSNLQCYS